jgi:glyoxylase-like metal-dependent hydrolase (beta-lactamase superfamily II)
MRLLPILPLAAAIACAVAPAAVRGADPQCEAPCAASPPPALRPVAIAPGVYAFFGDTGDFLDNIGPVLDNSGEGSPPDPGNSGFLVGSDGVIVVDNGISYRYGEAMLAAIARTTDRPVRLAIVTQAVQAFLFGSAAFSERGVPLLAHADTLELMRSRCEHCLENLRRQLGEEAMRGTRLVLPERTVRASTVVEAGGRTVDLLHFGWGATPGDLAVFDRASGVLFTGALVTVGRIPDLRDGRLRDWLAALDLLQQVPARMLIPAHGPAAGPEAIAELRAYLLALDAQAQAFYDGGLSLMQALDAADLPAYRHWAMYSVLHRRNLQQRYLELELEDIRSQESGVCGRCHSTRRWFLPRDTPCAATAYNRPVSVAAANARNGDRSLTTD